MTVDTHTGFTVYPALQELGNLIYTLFEAGLRPYSQPPSCEQHFRGYAAQTEESARERSPQRLFYVPFIPLPWGRDGE